MTGVAGGLLAGSVGKLYIVPVPDSGDSILLLAVVLMGGIYSAVGRGRRGSADQAAAGAAGQLGAPARPADDPLRRRDPAGPAHGAGGPRGAGARAISRRLLRRADEAVPAARGRAQGGPVIEITDLTVRFGGVTPLDGMSVTFDAGTCGLIGPNGAGKTTFFNVMSGFVRPAAGQRARVRRRPAAHAALPARALGPAAHVPDRAGDRGALGRSTTSRWSASTRKPRGAASAASDVLRRAGVCRPRGRPRREGGDAGRARAAAGGGRPRGRRAGRGSCCSTSRPPGCPTRRPSTSAASSARIPEHTGALVILVDHDMSLVSACCENTAVLDFGKLIAAGPTADGAARRARRQGLPRHGGGAREPPAAEPHRRARRAPGRARRLAGHPARRGDRAAGTQRRRQVHLVLAVGGVLRPSAAR